MSAWQSGFKQVDKQVYNNLQQLAADLRAVDTTSRLRALLKAGQRQSATIRSSWEQHCKHVNLPCRLYGHLIPMLTKFLYAHRLIRTNVVIQHRTAPIKPWPLAHHRVQREDHRGDPRVDDTQHLPFFGPPIPPGTIVQDGRTVVLETTPKRLLQTACAASASSASIISNSYTSDHVPTLESASSSETSETDPQSPPSRPNPHEDHP